MNNGKPLNGGQLIFYIKNHKLEILTYFRENGLFATLEHFHISAPTLERLMAGDYGGTKPLTKPERAIAMAEIAIAGNAELRREIREMREEYSQLVNMIAGQITARIAEALRSIEIRIPPELEHENQDMLKLKQSGVKYPQWQSR